MAGYIPPRRGGVRVLKVVYEGPNRRGRNKIRLRGPEQRKPSIPKEPQPPAEIVEKVVELGKRKVGLRPVEKSDTIPRKRTGIVTIQKEWTNDVYWWAKRLIRQEEQKGNPFYLAVYKARQKIPNKLFGKTFERKDSPKSTSTIFLLYEPLDGKFYYSSTRRNQKTERRSGPTDRRSGNDFYENAD
jgi:hypothetical protein